MSESDSDRDDAFQREIRRIQFAAAARDADPLVMEFGGRYPDELIETPKPVKRKPAPDPRVTKPTPRTPKTDPRRTHGG